MLISVPIFIFISVVSSHSILQANGASIEKLHARVHDRLAERLTDYEIIAPFLSTPEGQFISHRLGVHGANGDSILTHDSTKGVRNRRNSPGDGDEANEMHISFKAFGSELTLNVHKNRHLVAPNAVVEWITATGETEERIQEECFYIGEVKDKARSTVAISNCNGLAGLIQVNGDDYFIEPLEKNRTSSLYNDTNTWYSNDTESDEFLHVMYKRSAVRDMSIYEDSYGVAPSDFLSVASSLIGESIKGRVKRGTKERHMEVLLTADHSVVDFHGSNNIQIYLLTLMNIVNSVYKDDSLGIYLNIALVRIILLDASQAGLVVVGKPSSSLEKVCRWAHSQQNRDGTSKPHHDHAIFLTRQDFGPAGYAPVTGMCHLLRSCTLNREDGFASAFVMAHETGHVLGLEHDGQGSNKCKEDANDGSIMAPLVKATFNNYHWSSCSTQEMKRFIDTYQCLLDDPFDIKWPELEEELGIPYSLDDQCVFDFGEGYKRCTAFQNLDLCVQLWCSHPDNPYFCKTKKGPPLDGTYCGVGKWCDNGACVESLVKTTHGAWSRWSEFSQCSRSCGVGAHMRTRECNNPKPSRDGDDCKGQNVEFRLCNTQDCPDTSIDFRAEQCKDNYKNWRYKNRKHTWLPHENKNSSLQCKLSCISEETGDIIVSSYNVIDGTKCSYENPNNVCVQGQCQIVGCDKQLRSSLQEDQCGICGGDNTDCQTITGTYHKTPRKQYQRMFILPKGARHIEVYETSSSKNTISVKDRETGHYIFTNKDEAMKDMEFIATGIKFIYSSNNAIEKLTADGPLRGDISILLQSPDPDNPEAMSVNYKYVMHKSQVNDNDGISSISKRFHNPSRGNQIPDANTRFSWEMAGWSECSKKCGGGLQTFQFLCKRKSDSKIVSKKMCDQNKLRQPQTLKKPCNPHACERPSYDWVVNSWEYCSKTCGDDGSQLRTVRCGNTQNGKTTSVHQRYCRGSKPANRRACNRGLCPGYWQTGGWSECSVTCGKGTQRRQVVCGGDRKDVVCEDNKPDDTKSCESETCTPDSGGHCLGDKSIFCSLEVLSVYCYLPGYSKLCCRTCSDAPTQAP